MTQRERDQYDPTVHDRPDDDPAVAEGVIVSRLANGRAVLIPKALRDLRGEALETVSDLQHVAGDIGRLHDQLEELVAACRDEGVSWNSIGWCLGITAQSTQARFGPKRGAK